MKLREEKRKNQEKKKDPFLLSNPQTDEATYNALYKFDQEKALEEFSLNLEKHKI